MESRLEHGLSGELALEAIANGEPVFNFASGVVVYQRSRECVGYTVEEFVWVPIDADESLECLKTMMPCKAMAGLADRHYKNAMEICDAAEIWSRLSGRQPSADWSWSRDACETDVDEIR